jgi:alkylhydroperoxidase family enzyme
MIYPDPEVAKAVGEDPQAAPIPDLHKAMFRWTELFVKHSWDATPDDLAELKALGATDRDLADWLQIASTQVWFTSSADAGGIPMEGNAVTGPVMQHPREFYHQQVAASATGATPKGAAGAQPAGWLDAPRSGDAYDAAAAIAAERYGFVPNLFAAVSVCPDFYPRHQLALDLLETPQSSSLSAAEHALARAATVALDRCGYFEPTARALLSRHGEGLPDYAVLGDDPAAAARNDREACVLALTEKLVRTPYKITEKDAQGFRDAGLDDAAYVDVFNTVAIQTSLDKLANCIGVSTDAEPLLQGSRSAAA